MSHIANSTDQPVWRALHTRWHAPLYCSAKEEIMKKVRSGAVKGHTRKREFEFDTIHRWWSFKNHQTQKKERKKERKGENVNNGTFGKTQTTTYIVTIFAGWLPRLVLQRKSPRRHVFPRHGDYLECPLLDQRSHVSQGMYTLSTMNKEALRLVYDDRLEICITSLYYDTSSP